jgi:photosystem II stability/assembly factor-like uncharacterized protein
MVNMNQSLAPWRVYYDSRSDWPRSHGYKPFKRFEWDMKQRGWPDGNVPVGAYWEALQQRARMSRATFDEPWISLGPANHGGRARVLRFHPGHPDTIYVGAVSGGLWKSTNAGASWFPLTDGLANLAVGCFEIDPSNPDIMYLGTGEGYYNIDAVTGIGLLKSTNGGLSWNPTGLSYPYTQGESILKVNIDPRNGQIVLAATMDDLRRSTNGGQTWTSVLSGEIKDLVRDPSSPDVLLCAPGNPWGSDVNGIYRSTNNGLSWSRASDGLPAAAEIGRTVLAFSPSNPQVVWAGVCGTFSSNGSQMLGVWRSLNNGQSWTRMSPDGTSHYASQGWYDMAIAAKPGATNVVFSAGLDIHRSDNSGSTWTQLTEWWRSFGESRYVHADHHEIVFHPTHANELWEVTDGGIFKSTNNGASWIECNNGFVTFQYYAMGNATQDNALAYGGTQDNGTFRYRASPNQDMVHGGDGGYCLVDPIRDSTVYVESQNGDRYRSDDGCRSFHEINTGINGSGAWVTPMALDPFDHLTIYTTTTNGCVWKSTNQGRNGQWVQVGSSLASGDLQVIAPSPTVPGRLYVGSGSRVSRYDPSSGSWTNVTSNLPNGAWITRVVPDPRAANIVYVSVSGFGHGHIWKSETEGGAWQNISGNLPDVPFQDVIVDPNEPSTLYAGGDVGVFRTTNGGTSWQILGQGLPAVRVDDMELQTVTGVLRIATHGRGMWEFSTGGARVLWLYPRGGEIFEPGQVVELRWSGLSFGGQVRIEMNRSYPSTTWETLFAATANDGSENWTVTGPAADHVRWRIQHLTVSGQTDTSDSDTRIVLPELRILFPNGGDTILTGVRDTVRFTRLVVPEALQLLVNRDYPNGEWESLGNTLEDSLFLWMVRLPAAQHARLRLVSSTRPGILDESDGDFIIRPPHMSLDAPHAGAELPAGVPFVIAWSAPEHQGNVTITLNRDYPDGEWERVVANTINDGEYVWTPDGPASSHCRLRLATLYDAQSYVESAADFFITAQAVSDKVIPSTFAVSTPYPNPFNAETQLTLELPSPARVEARVFNRLGQEVALLADRELDAGAHRLTFDGSALPSGIYFIRVTAYGETHMMKVVMVK